MQRSEYVSLREKSYALAYVKLCFSGLKAVL